MSRVVAEQQTNTYPQVINVLQTDSGLMVVLQQIVMWRVVANRRTYLTLHAISVQWIDSGLMAVFNGRQFRGL